MAPCTPSISRGVISSTCRTVSPAFIAEIRRGRSRSSCATTRQIRSARRAEAMRILLLRMGNPAGQSYSDALVTELRLNGAGVAANGDRFREIAFEDRTEAGTRPELVHRMAEILAYRPHVVLDIATHAH